MPILHELTAQLLQGGELSAEQVEAAAAALEVPEVPDSMKADFLRALSEKGESAEEIAAFAQAFRRRAIDPNMSDWSARAIDIVGTGGDHSGGFNVSSLVVLTLAAAGVPAMKHGNRGITSKCGSADILAALGVDLFAPPAVLRKAMDQLGFVFFFAPNFHPSFKHIAPVRKILAAQGKRTVFNILGPLINPGRPAHVLLGSFSPEWVPRLAAALAALEPQAGLVVHGEISSGKGIDEITTATRNRVLGVGRAASVDATWEAEHYGLQPASFSELQGGDLPRNLALVDSLLTGKGPRGLEDTIVLNTAISLWLVGKTEKIEDGLAPARELLVGGAVRRKIEDTRQFYRNV